LAESHPVDLRKDVRRPLEDLYTEIQTEDRTIPARISDLSEGGMRLVLPEGYALRRDDEVTIAIGKVMSHIKGRVRWVQTEPESGGLVTLGVQFGGFVVEPRQEDEIQVLLDAWRDISQTYSTYDSFLHILQIIDLEILDGKIDNISDAVHSVAAWLDQRMGPLNVWSLIREANDSVSAKVLVERHAPPNETVETRTAAVRDVAVYGVTTWVRGRPYLLAGNIVIEYMGAAQDKIDLIQKLAAVMSTRFAFWSKLLIKNISLELLGEQMARSRQG
jgi:hypothetical protein